MDIPAIRIGHGYDVHRLVRGRRLVLGGVEIDYPLGLDGHSDADAALHALCDAILGALALGDIGAHFPDSDPEYKGIDSAKLLDAVVEKAHGCGYRVGNADLTVIAQAPKLAPYVPAMREKIARGLRCDISCVNVKATTEEKLGFTGSGEGIAAHAVVLMQKK